MAAPTLVTIFYDVTVAGNMTIAKMLTKMNAVPLIKTMYAQMDVTINSDATTHPSGNIVRRTLVFNLGPKYIKYFPYNPGNNDQAAPFRDLYTHTLSAALQAMVTASAPVLS